MPTTIVTPITNKNYLRLEAEKFKSHGLVSFSGSVTEKNGVKNLFLPPWQAINYENCLENIEQSHNALCIKTGKMSSVCVIDIDTKTKDGIENGLDVWNNLINEYGNINTWVARSGNNGLHYYFKYDSMTCNLINKANIEINGNISGIDIRNDGGIIIAAPSSYYSKVTKSIKKYSWINSPDDTELLSMPEWLFNLLNVDANIVKKTNSVQIKMIKDHTTNTITSESILNIRRQESADIKLLEKLLKLTFIKSYVKSSKYYMYYSDKCVTCRKEHSRRDGQYIIISSTIQDIIRLTFKCFHNVGKFSTIKMTRNNPYKLIYSDKLLKKQFLINNNKQIKKLMHFIPIGTHEVIMNEKINDISSLNNVHKINKEYLEHTDIDLVNYDTIYIKSIEGTNKSGSICDIIKSDSIPNIEKFIIINPNVSTLSSIKHACDEKQINYVYYEGANISEIRGAKVLIITINSLYKILNDDELVDSPNKICVWLDELNIIFNYIDSDTIKENRLLCYTVLKILIKFCGKLIITDADISKKSIDIIERARVNKHMMVLYNEYINIGDKIRDYHLVNTYNEMLSLIKQSRSNNEKIVIASDSKTITDLLYIRFALSIYGANNNSYKEDKEELKKYMDILTEHKEQYRIDIEYKKIMREYCKLLNKPIPNEYMSVIPFNSCNSVMLINSENNNGSNVLSRINEIIIENNISVLIISPSVSVGSNINIKYFDKIYGIFKESGPIDSVCQQQLNRVRLFNQKDQYLHFINCRGSNNEFVDDELMERYINDIVQQCKKTSKSKKQIEMLEEGGLDVVYDNNEDKIKYVINGFIPSIIAFNRVAIMQSKNNFKYRVLNQIVQRGHRVFIENKSYKLVKQTKQLDKISRKIEKGILDYKVEIKADELEMTPNITKLAAEELIDCVNKRGNKLSKTDKLALDKYFFMKKYRVKSDIDCIVLREFFIEANQKNYYDKVVRLIRFLKSDYIEHNILNNDAINDVNHDKIKAIKELIKLVGFTDFFDKKTIGYITTNIMDEFTNEKKKYVRMLFLKDNDVGRLRGSSTKFNIIGLLNRILENQFGVNIISSKPERKQENNKRLYKSFSHIEIDNTVLDYLIMRSCHNNLLIQKLLVQYPNNKFNRSLIHGKKNSFSSYANKMNNYKKYNFIDEIDKCEF
jgi:hypothetical protein